MSWRQQQGERVRDYAQYIETNLSFIREQIDSQGARFYPQSKSNLLIDGLRDDIYQEIPKFIRDSELSWQDIVDSAEDAEWFIDLDRQNSRIGQYENLYRRYKKNGFTFDRDGYVIVYTDGSCLGNGRNDAKGGIGVWFGNGHDWNVGKPMKRSGCRPTNQDCEIEAAITALKILKECGQKKVSIYTDSDFIMKSIDQWIFKWLQNGWRTANGREVKHKKKFRELLRLMENFQVKWVHVDAHQGEVGNSEADSLAKKGAYNDRH